MKAKVLLLSIISFSLIFLVSDMGRVSAAGDVVVVVNSASSTLSKTQIKRIFTAKMMSWPGGGSVKVLINKDKSIYADFCKKYLNSNPTSVDGKWRKNQIKSGAPLPRKVDSTVIKMLVGNSKVFIGFVRKGEMKGNLKMID